MLDRRHPRISRELFLAAIGGNAARIESWVTDRLTSVLEEEEVRAGDTLYSAGEPAEFFYLVREGRVQLLRQSGAPRVLEGRMVLGLFDALLDHPRAQSAVALTDLDMMKAPAEAFIELLEDSFELARGAFLGLANMVAHLEERLGVEGSREPSEKRTVTTAAPLGVVGRIAALMDEPLLRGAGVQALSDLALASEEVAFEPGAVLLPREAARDRLFLVVDGEVEASRAAPDVSWHGGPGEIVCGAAAFGDHALAWEARATTRVRALALRVEDWFDLMEEHFEMVRSTLATLAGRADALQDELSARPAAPA